MEAAKSISLKKGFTLIELVLALSLSALILTSLSMAFSGALKSYKENSEDAELIQHMRVAMHRVTSDLRYATSMMDDRPTNTVLEFYTTNLTDSDPGVETIRYTNVFEVFRRRVDDGAIGPDLNVAGTDVTNPDIIVKVTGFTAVPLTMDGGGNLIDNASDPIDDTVAVRVELTIEDADGMSHALNSVARFRNKT